MPTRFFVETVAVEDGSTYEREVLEVVSQTDGTSTACRVATDEDRVAFAAEYAAFKADLPEPPSHEELIEWWREQQAAEAAKPAARSGGKR